MTTATKQRIQVSLSPDVDKALKSIALRDRVPRARKVAELLQLALEIEEDMALGSIAAEREAMAVRFLTHKQVWG